MELWEIERGIRRGASKLSEALYFYWPGRINTDTGGWRELPEANIRTYLTYGLLETGWYPFSEVAAAPEENKKRVDIMAIHPESKSVLVGELKLLGNDDAVDDLLRDASKVVNFHLKTDYNRVYSALGPAEWSYFGLLAGTTWREDILVEWTLGETDGHHQDIRSRITRSTKDALANGARELAERTLTMGSVLLQDWSHYEMPKQTYEWHYFLYCLFCFRPNR